MKPHLQQFVSALSSGNIEQIMAQYVEADEAQKLGQLAFLYTQGQKSPEAFEPYQQLATKLLAASPMPKSLIGKINNAALLTFFTPALQCNWHFNVVDSHQRNVLHYLMLGADGQGTPPFNYLRSLMLFESNEMLQQALVQKDEDGFTPLELYFYSNENLAPLPNHEFTAVLALIEFQSNNEGIDTRHYHHILSALTELCLNKRIAMKNDLQRLQFVAYFYGENVDVLIDKARAL